MKTIKVLLIDHDINHINSIKKYFSNHISIKISICCTNGKNAIDIINKHVNDYEIVILDLLLAGIDGISIIKEINKIDKSKKVLVTTSYISKNIISRLSKLEVESIVIKPIEFFSLEENIIEAFKQNIDIENIENTIINILHNLGIPSHLKGYSYLKESIKLLFHNNFECMENLYSIISNYFNTNNECVEKNIRMAIDVGWNRGNPSEMERIFGYSICPEKGKPTNLQCIVSIVEKLKTIYYK